MEAGREGAPDSRDGGRDLVGGRRRRHKGEEAKGTREKRRDGERTGRNGRVAGPGRV